MDPVTHLLVGAAIGVNSGGGFSLTNGALAASAIGAVIPDLDFIAQLWGDLVYLKQHRGFSHSLPGLFLTAFCLGRVLMFFYSGFNFYSLFFWAFLGGLSHTGLDLFNSYGVKVFWPFSNKMLTVNLLNLVDPVLLSGCVLTIWLIHSGRDSVLINLFWISYPFWRLLLKYKARKTVERYFNHIFPQVNPVVLPSTYSHFKWDFIVDTRKLHLVGQVDLFKQQLTVFCQLAKIGGELKALFLSSPLGRFFRQFTPFFHVVYEHKDEKIIAYFVDLRYYFKNRFLHNGTLILDKSFNVEKSVFQPYSLSRYNYLTS